MTDVLTFSNPLWDLREFLRTHPLLAELSGANVNFRNPIPAPPAPFIRLYRVGGGPQASEAPKSDIRVAHEVWGVIDSDYLAVTQTVQALESIYQYAQNVLMGTGTVVENARVTSAVDAPDPDSGAPRIVVDALLTISL